MAVCFLVRVICDDQMGGCATLVNVVTGLLKDPITTAELAEFILFIVFIIIAELAEFISGLKQYNPKIF